MTIQLLTRQPTLGTDVTRLASPGIFLISSVHVALLACSNGCSPSLLGSTANIACSFLLTLASFHWPSLKKDSDSNLILGSMKCVELLLASGADPVARNSKDRTAIDMAAMFGELGRQWSFSLSPHQSKDPQTLYLYLSAELKRPFLALTA